MATVYNTTAAAISGVDSEVLAARPKRTFLTVCNLSTTDYAYLSLKDDAVSGAGMALAPEAVMTLEVNEAFNEALHAITSGAVFNLAIEERYEDEA